MKLISWNTNTRADEAIAQIGAIAELNPDVVALQEVSLGKVPIVRSELNERGYGHVLDTSQLWPRDVFKGPRRTVLLVASRHPIERLEQQQFTIPWPERILGARVSFPGEQVDVYTAHIPPGSSNGWIKAETLEGIYQGLSTEAAVPRILCGDFNTPQFELPTGHVVTWAQRLKASGEVRNRAIIRGGSGERWDLAERRILTGLREFGLVDVFRHLHGYGIDESSWYSHRKNKRLSRRFDHVFAALALRPSACRYVHPVREKGLSDHSPIEAVFG